MAKLKAPLLSFGARGQIAKSAVYFPWKGVDAVREYVIPANPRSTAQVTQRGYLTYGVARWHDATYTEADLIAWNRYAGIQPTAMSGFNVMVKNIIAIRLDGFMATRMSDIQIDTPTINGFDINVENSFSGELIRAKIGTRKTFMPTIVALTDDADGTYSVTWAGGVTNTLYYIQLQMNIGGTWYNRTGIYQQRTS